MLYEQREKYLEDQKEYVPHITFKTNEVRQCCLNRTMQPRIRLNS